MSQIVLNHCDCEKKIKKMYNFYKLLFLLPSKNQRICNRRDITPDFAKTGVISRLFTPPPKNQYLQMPFQRRIIISTATKTLKHWQVFH